MPSTTEAKNKTATNARLLALLLARTRALIAFCEFVGARPTDAKAAAMTSAWESRGIVYRRRGNVHGFRGVRLREDDDVIA